MKALEGFDPNGVGVSNGHFMGLPFTEDDARLVCISVPWDTTASYSAGTAAGPENIRKASTQLDLFMHDIEHAWKLGIFLKPSVQKWAEINEQLRPKAEAYIEFLEEGGKPEDAAEMRYILSEINQQCEALNQSVYEISKNLLKANKLVAVVGGEHSVPLGLMQALHEKYDSFAVLHIDAHLDLRNAYEGFTFSHASIFYNAVSLGFVNKLVQVGIRDYCQEEWDFAQQNGASVFLDETLKDNKYNGMSWQKQCTDIINQLPENVYISFDIDGLNPQLCPNTGTPVPGGLAFNEVTYLIRELVKSGKKIMGFDLCEVAGNNEWDGNVGARILYFLCCWSGRSQGWI